MSGELQKTITAISAHSTTLAEALLDTDTDVNLVSTAGFQTSFRTTATSPSVNIEGDNITYSGVSGNTITGLAGIDVGGHPSDAGVELGIVESIPISIEDVVKVNLYITRINSSAGTTVFTVWLSPDGTTWAQSNELIRNIANANTQMLTRIGSQSIGLDTTLLLTLDLFHSDMKYMIVRAVNTTDGTTSCIATLEYKPVHPY